MGCSDDRLLTQRARSGSDRSSSASKLELPRSGELGVGRGRRLSPARQIDVFLPKRARKKRGRWRRVRFALVQFSFSYFSAVSDCFPGTMWREFS
jgi:hypothetical protein